MNAAPGLYNKISLSKGTPFDKGFCYLHNDVDSHYPKKINFLAFKFPTVKTTKSDKSYFQFNKPLFLKQLFLVSSQFFPLVYQGSCAGKNNICNRLQQHQGISSRLMCSSRTLHVVIQ